MTRNDLQRIALWAALTVVIVTPAGLLLAWHGWAAGLVYLTGAGLAAVLGRALASPGK